MNIFQMGAKFDDEWTADNKNKNKNKKNSKIEIKPPSKHNLYFAKEKRRGKTVTIVKPFYLSSNDLKILLKNIKKKIGTGGTIKNNSLEFQGEISKKLIVELQKLGFNI